MTTSAYTNIRRLVADSRLSTGRHESVIANLRDLDALLDQIDALTAESKQAKEALGGFAGAPFDGTLATGINAISMRCAAAEKARQEFAPPQPSPTDPIDPNKWVPKTAWQFACYRLQEACKERDEARASQAAVNEHHARAFEILAAGEQLGAITLTELISRRMSQLNAITAAHERALAKENSAIATLRNLGYTDHGGAAWVPPLGPKPPLLSELVWKMVEADDKQTGYQRCEYMLKPVLEHLKITTL